MKSRLLIKVPYGYYCAWARDAQKGYWTCAQINAEYFEVPHGAFLFGVWSYMPARQEIHDALQLAEAGRVFDTFWQDVI